MNLANVDNLFTYKLNVQRLSNKSKYTSEFLYFAMKKESTALDMQRNYAYEKFTVKEGQKHICL